MFKILKKLFSFLAEDTQSTYTEPEFLNEYWVYVGTKSCSTVYARTTEEARESVIRDIRNGILNNYSYNALMRGDVYAVFKRTSCVKNPAYMA